MPITANDALSNLTLEERRLRYDMCRAFGHTWQVRLADNSVDTLVWHHYLRFDCPTCTMIRIDGLDALNDVGQRRYIVPDGYSYSKGETPSRSQFRSRVLNHLPTTD